MQGLKALAREPALHFMLLGSLLFGGQQFWENHLRSHFYPQIIFISTATQQNLRAQWASETGKLPDKQVLQALIRQHADSELLFQDAIAKGLHRGDPVIHQRLIQNIRFIDPDNTQNDRALLEQAYQLGMLESDLVVRRRLIQKNRHHIESSVVVTESELANLLKTTNKEATGTKRYHFQQLFFSAEITARKTYQQLEADPASAPTGEAFLLGPEHRFLSHSEIERRFGSQFANHFIDSPVGEWLPPVQSSYGFHLVKIITVRTVSSEKPENQRAQTISRLYAEQDQAAIDAYLDVLHQRYRVVVESTEVPVP